jgi:hypothetical protein
MCKCERGTLRNLEDAVGYRLGAIASGPTPTAIRTGDSRQGRATEVMRRITDATFTVERGTLLFVPRSRPTNGETTP